MRPSNRSTAWTFAITAIALFMVALDNLVVTTALPVIRRDLGSSLQDLEWMVNAYTLTFAVLLLTGAALGDRFGRRRFFIIGLLVFTTGSAAAALAPSSSALIVARAVQGVGAAFVTPLTLTILSAAVRPERRALALGAWGGIGGLAVAIGPLVGGAIAQGVNWHWIFWLNVPVGIVAVVLASLRLEETPRPRRRRSTSPGSVSPAPACSASSGASSTATTEAGRIHRCWPRSSSAGPCSSGSSPGSCGPARRCSRSTCSATAASPRRTASRS